MEQNRLDEYIKSFQDLFDEKGYGEAALKNDVPDGTLNRMVRSGFTSLVNSEDVHSVSFTIFGKFGLEKEHVKMKFTFDYNREIQTINLKSIAIQTPFENGIVVPLINSSFPSSQELYEEFLNYRKCTNNINTKRKPSKRKGNDL
ncbi:hypothetical protein AB6805_13560 [Chitinophaga sp. RCC_12]|uniref:hypothetical protein n=1 Tax=Chitinophaga sp. RCC_12 TaxID=3239226 RepID=UPI0035268C8B